MQLGPWTIHIKQTSTLKFSTFPLHCCVLPDVTGLSEQLAQLLHSCPTVFQSNSAWKGQTWHNFHTWAVIRRNEQSLLSLLRHFVKSYLPTFRSGVRVLPCSHIGRGLMCSGVVMIDHVCTWPIVFSRIFAFPSQFLDGFTLLVRIIPSPAPALYWRVTGNPRTQEVKTSALPWGLASFQPWKYNSSLVTGKLNIACLNTGKLSWELYNWCYPLFKAS